MSRFVRVLPRILSIVALAIGLLIFRNWAYVSTYRLYLSQRADHAVRSAAAQRFDIEEAHVVPQIVSRDDDLIAFKTAVGRRSTLIVDVRPSGRAGYEIRWRDGSTVEVLARDDVSRTGHRHARDSGTRWRDRIRQPRVTHLDRPAGGPRFPLRAARAGNRTAPSGIARAFAPTRAAAAGSRGRRTPRLVPAAGVGRRHRDQPPGARRRPACPRRSRPKWHRLRAPRPGRGAPGSTLGRHAAIRTPAAEPRRRDQRMAVWRHRANGIHPRGGKRRRPPSLHLPDRR